jgi:hypothetical protein
VSASEAAFIGHAATEQVPPAPFVSTERFAVFKDGKEVTRTNQSGEEKLARYGSLALAQAEAKKINGEARSVGYQEDTPAWVTLLLKSAIKTAVDEGKSWVAIATGEQAAGFFDLSKHIDKIEYVHAGGGRFDVHAW